jgi:hypothetical protein
VLVRGASEVGAAAGTAIDLASPEAPVTMNFYLNESCPAGRRETPVNLAAVSGQITFDSIYSPATDDDEVEIAAHFETVRFEDEDAPEERTALLSGRFRFFFNRGRPAQRFP